MKIDLEENQALENQLKSSVMPSSSKHPHRINDFLITETCFNGNRTNVSYIVTFFSAR